MELKFKDLKERALQELSKFKTLEDIENYRVKYLGKKGELTNLLKEMKDLPQDKRPIIGKIANEIRADLEEKIRKSSVNIKSFLLNERLRHEKIDITLPGKRRELGHGHPLSNLRERVEQIFIGMGFNIVEGPEIEYQEYNFEKLNIPYDHPAREEQDTFYINDDILLRTQTSSVQIRVMEKQKPPIRIISPGAVYRQDSVDATHSPIFHQIEGLVVDKNITFSNLKWTLENFIKELFGNDSKIRFRPHHFPYTEPSAEIDLECFACKGSGCSICKNEGFIEILGAGMVHPKVLAMCNIDPYEYRGFAFGVGLERIAMFNYEIDDIRLFYENDIRFLSQF